MDVQGAAVLYLLNIPEVVAAVGKTVITAKPFIFRDEMIVNLESKEYTAVSAIVIEDAGPMASLQLSAFRGRRLRMTIWANGDRDALGNFINPRSVRLKIDDTFKIVDRYLHRKDTEMVQWPGLLTVSCDRILDLSEPVALSEGDGIMIASAYYSVYF
jgi:hypothetical protein